MKADSKTRVQIDLTLPKISVQLWTLKANPATISMVYQTLSSRRLHRQRGPEVDGILKSSAKITQTPNKSNGLQPLQINHKVIEHDKASNKKAIISL